VSRSGISPTDSPLASEETKRAMRFHGVEFTTRTTQREAEIRLALAKSRPDTHETEDTE